MVLPTNLNRFGGNKGKPYYCEVEYIGFDGASFIDTGIYSSSDLKVELYCRGSRTNVNRAVFGGREATNINAYVIWHNLSSSSYAYYMRFDYSNGQRQSTSTWQDNKWIKVVKDKEDNYMNDVAQTSNTSASFLSSTTTVVLGAVKTGTTSFSYNYFLGDVSYCKIWDNGTLVRDYIPVIDWDGVICWYDKVTKGLFYNDGTGTFTAGRQIHYVEYLTSDGSQYIDTGVNPTFTMIAEIKCQSTVTSVCPIGAGGEGSNNRWQIIASTQYYSGRIGNKTVTNQNARSTDLVVAKLDGQTKKLTVNGVSVNLTGSTDGEIPTDNTLSLFRRNMYDGSTVYASFVGDIYWSKIWDNGVLLRDYMAAIDENGVGFMFDAVSHTIYDNAGSGAFAYPDVELEYLESSGTQYIDTGVFPDDTTGVKLKLCLSNVTTDLVRFGCRQTTGDTRFVFGHTNGKAYFGFGVLMTNSGTLTQDVPFTANLNFYNDRYAFIDNQTKKSLGDISGIEFTYTALLFARNYYGTISRSAQKMYLCQMTRGSNLILDLTPVIHEGAFCMYDAVSNTYFTNSGTGTFTGKIKEER